MGYVSRDIAVISEPTQVSISYAPNFVQFASKPSEKVYLFLNLWVVVTPSTPDLENRTVLVVTGADGSIRTFSGTTDPEGVGGSVFFVSTLTADTAENLRLALLSDAWIAANFNITIPFAWAGPTPTNGSIINILGLGAGDDYEFTLTSPNDVGDSAYVHLPGTTTSTNDDSISGEAQTAVIALDVYVNPDVGLGELDIPDTPQRVGTYLTTLNKTYYSGETLWFELNSLFNRYLAYNRPPGVYGWFDTGTSQVFRFIARVVGTNTFAFYQSHALFLVNGHGRPSEAPDMQEYFLQEGGVTLLTNKPRTPYVYGQKEYLNFIFQDGLELDDPSGETLRVVYRAYNTANELLGTIYDHERDKALFATVNTCALDIGQLIDAYPNTGIIRVSLAQGETILAESLEYLVRPQCLHELIPFTFLNALGGWDVFNFDAKIIDEVRPNLETYSKTLTPNFEKGESLETVYANRLDTSITVEGAPVNDEVAEWLKEFAGAKTIFDGAGNYIILEEFTLKQTPDTSNFHTPTFRYRLTEAYE